MSFLSYEYFQFPIVREAKRASMNFRGEYVTFPIVKLDKGHGSILSQISIRRIIIGYTILIAKLDYRKTKRRVSNLATDIACSSLAKPNRVIVSPSLVCA